MMRREYKAQAKACLRRLRRGTKRPEHISHFEHVLGDLRDFLERARGGFSLADIGTKEEELAQLELNHRREMVRDLVLRLKEGCSDPQRLADAVHYQVERSGKDMAYFGLTEAELLALEFSAPQKAKRRK